MKKVLLLSSLMLAATTSFAFDQVASANVTFKSIDMNADGFISSEEAVSYDALVGQFNSLDTDQDGMLSEDEFSQFGETTN
ncbi:hypothetical protein [Gynuella sp.]|uniref:hypothetical protein n=1 Tax=Gynuella sp. TaxID=2969146 RepID=UPI003D130982